MGASVVGRVRLVIGLCVCFGRPITAVVVLCLVEEADDDIVERVPGALPGVQPRPGRLLTRMWVSAFLFMVGCGLSPGAVPTTDTKHFKTAPSFDGIDRLTCGPSAPSVTGRLFVRGANILTASMLDKNVPVSADTRARFDAVKRDTESDDEAMRRLLDATDDE